MAKKKGSHRNAPGAGNIRKKIIHKNGQEYVYWEARLTVGFDPGTGKQIQRSFTGKTQKEVRERLQSAAVEVNTGTYTEPCKIMLGEWLDLWAAPSILELLKQHRAAQTERQRLAGPLWEPSGLVFTNDLGQHLATHTVYTAFKRIVTAIGRPDARFHDLRHSYAVAAIRSGDDIKTVQGNLGHATVAFTLDVYGHVTDQMKQESAARMESYIKDVLEL